MIFVGLFRLDLTQPNEYGISPGVKPRGRTGPLCNAVKKPSGENLFIEGLAKVKMIGSAST